ncbi:MAG: cell division protein FtsQ/DivIB [Lactobacillus sp.]|nr:cell division protein FtsQ/DivIB [Lactobacillus sp.]
MSKKRVTKLDPRKQLSNYLDHRDRTQAPKTEKVSKQLSGLKAIRKRSFRRILLPLMLLFIILLIALGYYVSPLSFVSKVSFTGANDIVSDSLVKALNIKSTSKIPDLILHEGKQSKEINKKYPEIDRVKYHFDGLSGIKVQIFEAKTLAYVRESDGYQKVLANGKMGKFILDKSMINSKYAVLLGKSNEEKTNTILKLYNKLPESFRNDVKIIDTREKRASKLIFVMKNGNLVIANTNNFLKQVKYYDAIASQTAKKSVIDMEVGAFTRALTSAEKQKYDIR